MTLKYDLDRLLRNPGSVKRRALVAALSERGWMVLRESGEQIWEHPSTSALNRVPRTLKGAGTIRAIIRLMIEVESRGAP